MLLADEEDKFKHYELYKIKSCLEIKYHFAIEFLDFFGFY